MSRASMRAVSHPKAREEGARTSERAHHGGLALALALALPLLCGAACAGSGQFTWYRDLPRTEWGEASGEYVVGVGDSIKVQVYEQESLATATKVRSDGRIALPLIGEIVAAGMHPTNLAREIETRLKQFIVSPRAVVNVEESQPITVSVLGEVGHVGALTLEPSSGLLQALAQAGGPNDYADKSSIFVLRRSPEFRRIRFTYEALVQNQGGAATFPLHSGDVIVVE
jgi:polysaccharide export outer membrane protein